MRIGKKIIEELRRIPGRQVFFVYCGPSTGSVLDIHFTPTQRRAKAIRRPLSLPEHEFQGSISLFVQCSWRLIRGNELCGSSDCIEDAEKVFEMVRRLCGSAVKEVTFSEASGINDPTIVFENGSIFQVFCDCGFRQTATCTLFVGESSFEIYSD